MSSKSQQLALQEGSKNNDKLIQFSEAMNTIVDIIDELASKDRNKHEVKKNVSQLSARLKDALVMTKENEDRLGIINETYKTDLVNISLEQAKIQKLLKETNSERGKLDAKSKKIDSKLCDLNKSINDLSREIISLEKEKRREKEMRMIPFYGIISVLDRKVEKLQRRTKLKKSEISNLKEEQRQIRTQMTICSVGIFSNKVKESALSTSMTLLELNMKLVGKLLTDVGNLKKNLGYMDTKTQRMLGEIDLLKEADELGHDMFEGLVPLNEEMLRLCVSISNNQFVTKM